MRRRWRLRWAVVLLMTCQVVGVAASPYASCRDHDHTRHVDDDHGAADHACAMHHHMGHVGARATHDAPPVRENGPTLRCQCRASDAALAALILRIGNGSRVLRVAVSTRDGEHPRRGWPHTSSIDLPETPPPRA